MAKALIPVQEKVSIWLKPEVRHELKRLSRKLGKCTDGKVIEWLIEQYNLKGENENV